MSNPTPDHNVTRDNQQPVSPGATPRTDREQYQVIPGADHKEDAVVSVDFARELERENNALRARVAFLERELSKSESLVEFNRSLANSRLDGIEVFQAQLAAATSRADALQRECEKASSERSEWMAIAQRRADALAKWREAAEKLAEAEQESNAALVSVRSDRPSAHTDEVWAMLNRAINHSEAALTAYRALAAGQGEGAGK